jgi:hypothetical protein
VGIALYIIAVDNCNPAIFALESILYVMAM